MRYQNLFAKTRKEAPKDELSVNAKLLLRGGFIDKLMAGSYTLLPLGRIVERKIENIIREEINSTEAQEILMPLLHPKEIWNETGRWESAADVMYQFAKDQKHFALSFTHEEIVMDLLRKHVLSYKDLPVKIYHFSTKFRSELRAKSGILRGREFLMKDLYSAHANKEDLMEYYWQVVDAYLRIFTRMGLEVVVTEASGGVFTDNFTHEFQLKNQAGEDTIYKAKNWKYWKNKEIMTKEDFLEPDLEEVKAIEVGNIFPLGTSYAEKMGVYFTDREGRQKPVWFGSYGIGLTRLVGALVETSHDEKGIIWPERVAPYQCHLVAVQNSDSGVQDFAEEVYTKLQHLGVEVLYDDREDIGAGQKFADADLLGMPVRLVISSKTLGENAQETKIEWKERNKEERILLSLDEVILKLKEKYRQNPH